jgi:hypothetical protein
LTQPHHFRCTRYDPRTGRKFFSECGLHYVLYPCQAQAVARKLDDQGRDLIIIYLTMHLPIHQRRVVVGMHFRAGRLGLINDLLRFLRVGLEINHRPQQSLNRLTTHERLRESTTLPAIRSGSAELEQILFNPGHIRLP